MANHRAGKREASRVDSARTEGGGTRPAAGGKRKAVKPSRAARRRAAHSEPTLVVRERSVPRDQPAPAAHSGPAPSPHVEPAPPARPAPAPAPRTESLPTATERVARTRSAPPTRVADTPLPRTTPEGPGSAAHAAGRKSGFGLPSTPTIVGAAALVAAAAGAVTVGQHTFGSEMASGNIQRLSAQANALSGASDISSSDETRSRQQAVSRDSERQALQDASAHNLQAAAEAQARQRNAALAALAASAEKRANELAALAWQLPVAPGVYHLTAGFGETSGLWSSFHTGLDFAAPIGTPIRSVAKGVVTSTGWAGAYGNRTIVTLPDGTELWYCHQNAYNVSEGQSVMPGDVIGFVGATGNVTGPHLHLEVRPGGGDPVDPYAALVHHGLHP